ncbi:sulfite exporter TauE/SafE family protein [Flagellimonas halotolerans]|uniref:Probable membrane transporter protein n=1 Tax=Flagellimonas halotolerans TaxID=3112164 RepID=A0ABU6IMI4_9FLAO|nr:MULTISPECIES: sulfite exporter TauE/SafE family protein [unclassified Allomuricauda]MEC3964391.1 sulfite exporter TauE/SafE family protein [Muricauda sp. SYSU M86414]MEC4264261.1 sulfite exporter TauE/SafE family protein [Muricauda sp. SYSU M84420]
MKINYIFLLLALFAEIIGTIGGFGSSVFFVPLGNFYFDFYSVLGMTAIFHLSSNLSKIFLFKKGLDKKLLLYIGAPSVLFVIVGGFLSKIVNSSALEIVLGVFLVAFSLLFLIKSEIIILPNKKNSVIGGALSGFSAGLLGTGGAIRGLTMAAFNLEKSAFIATSAFIDFMIDFSRTFVYYGNGYIGKQELTYLPFLFVIGLVGTYLGKRILHYIPQEKFRKLSLIFILIIGLATIAGLVLNYWGSFSS